MRAISLIVSAILGLLTAMHALSHPATERYIPIGDSPGVSKVKSYIGAIRSVATTASGLSISVEDTSRRIEVTEYTKIYLDRGPGKTNLSGNEEDCKVGRLIEAYLHDDGKAYWIKIRMY